MRHKTLPFRRPKRPRRTLSRGHALSACGCCWWGGRCRRGAVCGFVMALGSPHLLFQRCLRDRVICLDFNLQAPCRPQSAIAVPITFPRGRTLPRHPPDRPCSHHRIRAHSWPHAKSWERVNWPPWRNRCQTAALQGFDTFPVSGPYCTSDLANSDPTMRTGVTLRNRERNQKPRV